MSMKAYLPYLLVMAIVTYLIRVLPLVLIRKKIHNRFVRSFLYYVPYTVLSAMTFPAILYATGSRASALAGLVCALVLSYRKRSLIVVAAGACAAVLAVEYLMLLIH